MINPKSFPTTWKLLKCHEVIDVRDGTHDTPAKVTNGIPLITSKNLKPEGINFSDVTYISETDHQQIEKRSAVDNGDILFAMIGTIGNPVIVKKDRPFSIKNVALFKLGSGQVMPEYFKSLLSTQFMQSQLTSATRGGTQKFVSLKVLRNLIIPVPPIAEQRRIAAILDKAEELRELRRQALRELDAIAQSIFVEMFGDPASNPKGWPIVPFSQCGENQDNLRIPVKSADREQKKNIYPYYGASGIIDWVDQYIFEGERLLIGEDGANLLARSSPIAFIARGKYWVNNHAHVISFNGFAELLYLEFLFSQIDLKPYVSGSAQPKLNRTNLDRIPIPLAPISLQQEFVRRIEAIEQVKTTHRESLTQLDALFASLQHRAFRGEL